MHGRGKTSEPRFLQDEKMTKMKNENNQGNPKTQKILGRTRESHI